MKILNTTLVHSHAALMQILQVVNDREKCEPARLAEIKEIATSQSTAIEKVMNKGEFAPKPLS